MLNFGSNRRKITRRGAGGLNPWERWARCGVEELEPRLVLSGTWTPLANMAPDPAGIQTLILLPDGTVMGNGGDDNGNEATANVWYKLSPDKQGNFVNGTWSTLPAMSIQRQFFTSDVLSSDKVFVYGGEYSGPNLTQNFINSGDIYDLVTNTWSPVATIPAAINPLDQFGDDPSEVLDNGTILAGFIADARTFIYDPVTNSWSLGPTKLANDQSDEESWEKLPGGDILSYNVFGNPQTAQRFNQAANAWVFAGNVPVQLQEPSSAELGPGFALPDGRAFQIGATPNNAVYNPATNTWTATPVTPGGLGANDAPGAVEPNGMVLYFAGDTPNFGNTTSVFEYDPVANTVTPVALPPALAATFATTSQFLCSLVVLPNGQILMSDTTNQLWVYTPVGAPKDIWRPTIKNIVNNGNGTFTLTGTQITGLDEGSNYGDDRQNATNYPIVRVTDNAGNVFYCRTFNWSTTRIATGSTPETCQFVLPAGISTKNLTFVVIANGIASFPFSGSGFLTFHPFRYIYNPATGIYSGNVTIENNGLFPVSGTFTITFPSLPPGVKLVNATGTNKAGQPIITVNASLPLHGTLRILIELTDPLRVYLSSFFQGFPINVSVS
ncbi:MAG TPA: kelch repeat-containing protein [Gemmataceae bacterium]|nr:kelch repeat-containing protein [Gemmataceae bacterium]